MAQRSLSKAQLTLFGVFLLLLTAACTKEPPPPPTPPQTAERESAPEPTGASDVQLTENQLFDRALGKWTGDLDGMIERRMIRVLTTPSKTTFFVDRGTQLGLVADVFRLFEDDLNKRLNNKNIQVQVVFVPVAHDDLIPTLLEGRGDVVAAGTLTTAWRKAQVDFTNPTRSGISSIIVTGPGVPPIATVQDLGGKEVYLRTSDVSIQGVERFNAQLAASGKPPVKIRRLPKCSLTKISLRWSTRGWSL